MKTGCCDKIIKLYRTSSNGKMKSDTEYPDCREINSGGHKLPGWTKIRQWSDSQKNYPYRIFN